MRDLERALDENLAEWRRGGSFDVCDTRRQEFLAQVAAGPIVTCEDAMAKLGITLKHGGDGDDPEDTDASFAGIGQSEDGSIFALGQQALLRDYITGRVSATRCFDSGAVTLSAAAAEQIRETLLQALQESGLTPLRHQLEGKLRAAIKLLGGSPAA